MKGAITYTNIEDLIFDLCKAKGRKGYQNELNNLSTPEFNKLHQDNVAMYSLVAKHVRQGKKQLETLN